VAVVGAEFAFLARGLARSRETGASEYAGNLVATVRGQIRPQGGLNVARILAWPSWGQFADALLLDSNLQRGRDGRVRPAGIALNPLGSLHRGADFDYQAVYGAIALAVQSGDAQDGVEGGRVVPIEDPSGMWGACWYKIDTALGPGALVLRIFLPIFLVSTVLLSAGTFLALRRFVLDPVAELAQASRRVAEGDLAVRVREPPSGDELAEMMRAFNTMAAQVEGFSRRLADEVERATAQARAAEAAAMTQRRLAAMGELAAGIAHEINNPLGGLLNAVEALERDRLAPERRRQYLGLLSSGLERIRLTVGRLLRFTPRQARPVPFEASAPVVDAIALVRHRAARQGTRIAVRCGTAAGDGDAAAGELARAFAELPLVLGEPHEVAQAVLNLLVNALDALEPRPGGGGSIEVALGAHDGEVWIEVQDDGPGVPQEALGRISDLFFTTKEAGRGTGLGLAIVHRIAADHGGRLEIVSRPGQGFRATLVLPAHVQGRAVAGGAGDVPASGR
jgi:signal transduction histidine kinase